MSILRFALFIRPCIQNKKRGINGVKRSDFTDIQLRCVFNLDLARFYSNSTDYSVILLVSATRVILVDRCFLPLKN